MKKCSSRHEIKSWRKDRRAKRGNMYRQENHVQAYEHFLRTADYFRTPPAVISAVAPGGIFAGWVSVARATIRSDCPSALMYRDEDFDRGEHILDNWSLMNIAFRGSDQFEFTPARVNIADGGSLSQLTAAPRFEDLWKKPESVGRVVEASDAGKLAARARLGDHTSQTSSRTYTCSRSRSINSCSCSITTTKTCNNSAPRCISSLAGIDSWPVSTWLRLLETRNITALATICEAMNQRSASRSAKPGAMCRARLFPRHPSRTTRSVLASESIDFQRAGSSDAGKPCRRPLRSRRRRNRRFALSILGATQVYRTDTVSPAIDDDDVPELRFAPPRSDGLPPARIRPTP